MMPLETRSYAGAIFPFLAGLFPAPSMTTSVTLAGVPARAESPQIFLVMFSREANTSNTAPEMPPATLLHTDAGPVTTKQRPAEVGRVAEPRGDRPRDAIIELRRLTGLPWETLADLLSATRRSLHLWVNGRPMNTPNERRVRNLLGAMRAIDRGTARENRSLLLTRQPDGTTLEDLLREQRFEEILKLAGRGHGRPAPAKTLGADVPARGYGPSLADMLGTSAERVHRDSEVALPPRRRPRRM